MPTYQRIVKAVVALWLGSAPWASAAGREPVLKQIQVPHSYYYREMYLPQVTSGPGGAAWSPDSRELVYSMQGSLWRQKLGSTQATQLTNGPGYDHQPDWSPDGRFVAFSSYRDDAIELWILDLANGKAHALTSNGAVNVEPRWSPDGRKLAFVSTLLAGRWQIYTLDVNEGAPGALTRLTDENDSGLPRYYYSRFDHALSPSWSPDGSEILFVSNRGHIWGSGGFWRMQARSGAPAREIRYEETTWKARPDWSRDGRRVVYSSYLGRQWNQLWLMTAEGGDPFPLTYEEHDFTNPRWSPDGQRIAFISNETGNTSLWVMDVPGGARVQVEARERRYLGPVGRLAIEIRDPATGGLLPARVSVTTADGRSHAPDDAWRHADDGFDRAERKVEYGYFHTPGRSELMVPAGPVSIEVLRGLESRPVHREIQVDANATTRVTLDLARLDDLSARGWWSGDLHVHMNYGGHYRNDPKHLAFQATAEDLHVVESLIVNKEQRVPDIASFDKGRPDPAAGPDTLVVHGQEYHTSYWGHTALLGLRDHILLPAYAAYFNTPAASLHPMNATIADLAHAQGAIMGYVHPFDAEPDPGRADAPLTNEFPVDVALGKVDFYETVSFTDHLATNQVWYRLLNCGFRIPTGAGTDAMANFASLHGPVGMQRVYVKTGARPDHDSWLGAIKAGRTFATNGPLLEFSLGGREIGDEIALPARGGELEAKLALRSIVPVDHLQVVGDGRVVAEIPLSGDRTTALTTLRLKVARSGWYVLRAFADRSRHPVLDIYPYATTSPIYVVLGGRPPRSKPDADYFSAWVRRLEEGARAHQGWNSPQEREGVLETLATSRAVFEKRATER